MFDISFTELLVIGVIALVVIGPERLPKVARTVGHLLGRAQRYVSDVKGDINREVELSELKKMKEEMENAARNVTQSMQDTENSIRGNLDLMHASQGQASSPLCDTWQAHSHNRRRQLNFQFAARRACLCTCLA